MKVYIGPYPDEGEQKIDVHIDKYDTWSMDHTLSYIIVPMLKQLKDTKHGAPNVDPDDVPAELRTAEEWKKAYEGDGTTDENFFKRWDWVLDEMIFAFESKLTDWEDQFYSGESDTIFAPVDKDGSDVEREDAEYFEWRKGPNHTLKINLEGRKKYQERMSNGFRLFGKYYEALWD